MLALVLGGIRSGKSEVAEDLARRQGEPVVYVATGSVTDEEMAARIERHRERRPSAWRTVETADPEPVLAGAGSATVLLDALGPWLVRLMDREGLFEPGGAERSPAFPAPERIVERTQEHIGDRTQERVLACIQERILGKVGSFARAAARRPGLTVVVAEESGLGLVPAGSDGAATRLYLDLAGRAAQTVASAAATVRLVVAGQSLDLKRTADPAGPTHLAGPTGPTGVAGLREHGDTMVPAGALDFAVNVVPGPPPEWLTAAIEASFALAGRYPDDGRAIRAVADRHGRSPGEVLVLGGSAEAFWLLATALRPARAACVHPSFTEGEAALRATGCRPRRVFRDPATFALDPGSVPADADFVVVCNPNNPTGTLDVREHLERLVRPGRVLVIDEAFMDLCPGESESLASSSLPGLVVVRSLTKTWSIPGVRAGYLVGPPDVVAALRAHRQPWPVSTPALAAIEACVRRPEAAHAIAVRVARWREALLAGLRRISGVRVWPPAANFALIEVPDGPAVRSALLERGIAVRRADTFPGLGPGHLRVAVRGPEDDELLVSALRDAVRSVTPGGILAGRNPV